MKRTMMNLEDYPILGPVINISPGDMFRVEGVEMEHEDGTEIGSGIFMFTGLFRRYENSTTEYIYCIPIHFYGDGAPELTKAYTGRNVWIIITEISHPEQPYHEGYLN